MLPLSAVPRKTRSLVRPKYRRQKGDRIAARYDLGGMKKSIYLLAMLALFAACEQKTTTVNPPAEKKESNTTIVNPPSEKKETKTDINVNTSPNP
jgi:predicted small lipoprotein YifL